MKLRITLFKFSLFSSLVLGAPTSKHGPNPHGSGPGGNSRNRPSPSPSPDRNNDNGPRPYPPLPEPKGCKISPQNIATYCAPPVNLTTTLLTTYTCGDWRLGPLKLPSMIPLDSFVEFYHKYGALCPGEFITKYWNANATRPNWRYPQYDGFALDSEGNPIIGKYTLDVGVLVDRFGGEGGGFVSPAAAPYIQRALPPNNLDSPQDDPKIPYNYHLYRVAIAFEVEAGPIAPWFEQPGQGVQYHLLDRKSVKNLVDSGYLVRQDPLQLYFIQNQD